MTKVSKQFLEALVAVGLELVVRLVLPVLEGLGGDSIDKFETSFGLRFCKQRKCTVIVNRLTSLLRDAGSWNSVPGCPGLQVSYLISIFWDLGYPLILNVSLMGHQILQLGSLLTYRPIRELSWCD